MQNHPEKAQKCKINGTKESAGRKEPCLWDELELEDRLFAWFISAGSMGTRQLNFFFFSVRSDHKSVVSIDLKVINIFS